MTWLHFFFEVYFSHSVRPLMSPLRGNSTQSPWNDTALLFLFLISLLSLPLWYLTQLLASTNCRLIAPFLFFWQFPIHKVLQWSNSIWVPLCLRPVLGICSDLRRVLLSWLFPQVLSVKLLAVTWFSLLFSWSSQLHCNCLSPKSPLFLTAPLGLNFPILCSK